MTTPRTPTARCTFCAWRCCRHSCLPPRPHSRGPRPGSENPDRAARDGHTEPGPGPLGAATAIVVNGTPYLIDFGPGVVRRVAAAQQKGVEGLSVTNLRVAFLTHLHSDHTAGFPDLILTPWAVGRSAPWRCTVPRDSKA